MWECNRLKLIAGILTLGVIAPAMYLLFLFLFGRLIAVDDAGFGVALSGRLLSTAFMAFSVFLAVSSLIGGISILYRSRETSMLLGLPVRSSAVAVFRTAESWFYAGWSTLLMGVPVILAFSEATGSGPGVAVAGLALLVPLVLSSTAAGSIVLAVLSRLGSIRSLRRGAVGAVAMSALMILVFLRGSDPGSLVIPDSSAGDLQAVHRFVAGLPAAGHSPWPHALFGAVLTRLGTSGPGQYAGRAAAILAAESAVLAGLALSLTAVGFRGRHASMAGEAGLSKSRDSVFRRGGLSRALVEKEALLFARDPVQWSQLALLGGLFLMYAGNLDELPVEFAQRVWLGVAVFMNISFSGFVMATLMVRFSFPSISMEGPGLASLLQMPAARRTLLRTKWAVALVCIMPLVLGAGILSTVRMGAGGLFLAETVAAIILMSSALASINTAMGAIYPSFTDNSPASIASGQGGILAAFASMGYVLAMVTVISFSTREYLSSGMSGRALAGSLWKSALFMVPLTAIVSAASMRGAARSLGRRDF